MFTFAPPATLAGTYTINGNLNAGGSSCLHGVCPNSWATAPLDTSLAFAVVEAVLAGVPLGVAAGVPTLIDSFEKLIEGKLDKRYNTGVLTSIINRFIDTIEGNARSGAVVPGFRIRPNVNAALAGNDEVIEIRKQVGRLFNDELKDNLGSFYKSRITPSNFYLR